MFGFVENPDKIPENLGKNPENPRETENLGKIPENPRQNGAQPCLTSKMVPTFAEKHLKTLFWRSHRKKAFLL